MAAFNFHVARIQNQLFDEVRKGNLEMIKAMAVAFPGVLNAVAAQECTILHLAALNQRLNVIEWLLSDEGRAAGFKRVLSKVGGNQTAFRLAVKTENVECCKAIAYGCKVENGEREEMLNDLDENGYNVLHLAVSLGILRVVKWLVSDKKGGGRDAGFTSILAKEKQQGWTVLHGATELGNLEIFTAIVEGCKVENGEREKMLNALSNQNDTVLHVAAFFGRVSIIKWLLSTGRELGFTGIFVEGEEVSALQIAIQQGHLEACKAIVFGCKVENGERDKMLNSDRTAPLFSAAFFGHTSIASWLLSDKPGGGRTLGFKSVLARRETVRSTVLHAAAEGGHFDTCKAIVSGCKVKDGEREKIVNAVDGNGRSALYYAVRYGSPAVASWLLSSKPDGGRSHGLKSETILALTMHSQSVLHAAAESGSIESVRALLSGCTVGERLKLFLAVDGKGWTVLHYAAQFGRRAIIRELLLHHEETKMIVDHRDYQGMTVLHRVVLDGGVDKESKDEWKIEDDSDTNRAPREEVVEALLTYEIDDDEEGGGAASSTKKGNKKKKQQQQPKPKPKPKQQEEQQQQAAFIDVNLGLKIEERKEK